MLLLPWTRWRHSASGYKRRDDLSFVKTRYSAFALLTDQSYSRAFHRARCNGLSGACLPPATQQLLSRTITVATYALSLECGHMLALPTWLRIICAYSVAALVPTLLPNAHGDNCRVFTTIAASILAAALVSPAAAVGVSFVLCLCPTRMLWWPNDEETDTVTSLLREVLKWMDAHDDVLPVYHRRPTPRQKEEYRLRLRYKNFKSRTMDLTRAQRALQVQIDRRATNQKDLDVLKEVERWSAKNNNKLPVETRGSKEEKNIAQRLRRLQRQEHLTPILQRRLDELSTKSHKTPTKATARGAVARDRRRRRIALLSNQAEEHRDWCQLHYPALTQEELDDRFQQGQPSGVVAQPYPGLANLGNTCYVNAICQALLHC